MELARRPKEVTRAQEQPSQSLQMAQKPDTYLLNLAQHERLLILAVVVGGNDLLHDQRGAGLPPSR